MAEQRDGRIYGKRDPLTGERWVHVGRAAAHAHPKGRLHWVFVLVALCLFVIAALKARIGLQTGGVGWAAALAFLPAFTGVLVLMRAPIARILLIVMGAVSIYGAVQSGLGQGNVVELAEILVVVTLTIWMWEGERPNLAYGYRYRGRRGDDG